MTTSTPRRVPPLERSAWPDGYAALLDATVAKTEGMESGSPAVGQPVGILPVLANHPTIMEPFLRWADALAHGRLSRRQHELLALRAISRLRSEFEYGHHVAYARGAGLSDGEIQALTDGTAWAGWDELDRALVAAADELLDDHVVSEATWAVLAASLDVGQLVEVPLVVGQYTMLSFVADTLGVELEEGYDRLPSS